MQFKSYKPYAQSLKINIPIDRDIARTPKTRCPFHCMTFPPAASILAYSSSRFG